MWDELEISKYSEIEFEIVNHLKNGRSSVNIRAAKNCFNQALSKTKEILHSSEIAPSLYLESMYELADIEYDIKKRTTLWKELFKELFIILNKYSNNEDLVLYCGDALIYHTHEAFLDKDLSTLKQGLSILKGKIDRLIKSKDLITCSALLVKKAAVLRNLAKYQATQESQKSMLEEALRCVQKSISISKNTWYAFLELGNCFFRLSYYDSSLQEFNTKITQSENAFLHSRNLKCTVNNTLALCQLYKETYQYLPLLESFNIYEKVEENKRRHLKNSYLLSETLTNMFYSNYPSTSFNEYLIKADRLLDEARLAGYRDARIITNLAFIKACRGEISVGEHILKTLRTSTNDYFDWNLIIDEIDIIKDSEDLFSQGFVLGIDEASIWNKLGTFALIFLNDIDLGIKFYRVALHINPKNPIVLTNLARALIKVPLSENIISEAENYISRASSFSNFRFQWWREVMSDVAEAKSRFTNLPQPKSSKKTYNFSKIADLYKWYHSLKEAESPHRRGYDFEKIVYHILNISLLSPRLPYRITGDREQQIDGAFCLNGNYYRVETKWEKNQIDHTDITLFHPKLKTSGVKGLFISHSGFTKSAITTARELKNEVTLLLMDGEEIESILKGNPTFDEAIRLKMEYFSHEDNPYFKVNNSNNQGVI